MPALSALAVAVAVAAVFFADAKLTVDDAGAVPLWVWDSSLHNQPLLPHLYNRQLLAYHLEIPPPKLRQDLVTVRGILVAVTAVDNMVREASADSANTETASAETAAFVCIAVKGSVL
jgi:hypothetical protein